MLFTNQLLATGRRGALVLVALAALSITALAGTTTGETPLGSPQPAPTPVRSGGQGSDTTQGRRYGTPGFVGEPINLNVVNADIRDILNYITEQYGVNFVIDNSVGAVPVTVNVSDVPWNYALDSVLKANRLGVDVNGNILRIATTAVLASEAADIKTAKDNQLDGSDLFTEFIRLNYARAQGTLGTAAGSSGNFQGGNQGASGGDSSGAGGDTGILGIVQRRLSRRGSVEVDGRSNTLIITDVRENIDAIRQLVRILDQPEPQVEIETRIVLASRNFSRDLGVQLSALINNPFGQGGFGVGGTLPVTGGATGTAVPHVGAGPGGQPIFPVPGGGLGVNGATTVIGLTTGLFGSAQISIALTAAEAKGQAKIVASPRVTVLNNRSAQIESGSQIPVVTTQAGGAGGGGASQGNLLTTTFVSVPLRLSVTPQITDAGTVLLRVVAENNSVNTALANGLTGTPGIDTQRMSTEVLVPDGGTTVVGGAIQDSESNASNRTPGLGTLPIIGNLFKRKTVTRQTNEILFFITPRIYRPDYQGNPTGSVVNATGNRTTTILQPVPLGNPPSNSNTGSPQNQTGQPQNGQPVVPATGGTTSPAGPANPTARPSQP
ncbi:MAG: type IV pilus secretin PilQ [Pyrinomonadaceae bacterium]